MKVYSDLEIAGDHAALQQAIADIEARLANGWARNVESEQRLSSAALVRCFHCTETPSRRAASVWLAQRQGGPSWNVTNIIPDGNGRLTYDEYNALLDEFRTSFVQPVANALGLEVRASKADMNLEDFMSEMAARALTDFCRVANKQTGSAHPRDRERWFKFLIQLHHDRKAPSASFIRRWLIERERWSPDVASDLAVEYESALELLKQFNGR
jgi:hypothetical protein